MFSQVAVILWGTSNRAAGGVRAVVRRFLVGEERAGVKDFVSSGR